MNDRLLTAGDIRTVNERPFRPLYLEAKDPDTNWPLSLRQLT
jgi:hypothetical protein